MKTSKTPPTDLFVVTERPAFLELVRKAVSEHDSIHVKSMETGPRSARLNGCLTVLETSETSLILVDTEADGASMLALVQEIFDRRPSPRVFVAGSLGDTGLMLRAQHAGAAEFIPLPLDGKVLAEAVARFWKRSAPAVHTHKGTRGRVMTFLSAKGGCGATTLATNLAVTLASAGRSTLLVDLDLAAGDAALLLNLSPTFSVSDAVANTHRMDRELLNGMVLRHVSGVEVLAASESLEKAVNTDPARVAQLLQFVREQYEFVLVNTGELTEPSTQAALGQSDMVHVITTLDLLALRRAQWCLRRLEQNGVARDLVRLVVNRYDRNPYITLDEAEKVLELKVSWTVPQDTRSIPEALNDGIPFVSRNRNGLATCFEDYATALSPGGEAAAPARRKVLGIFPKGMARISHHGASA
jgi:pilus assembly protein CpaE